MSKRCKTCGETKPLAEFYGQRSAADGHMSKCKACWCEQVRERRRTNPAVQAYDRERAKLPHRRRAATLVSERWREEHPEAYRAQTAVGNALRDGKLTREPCYLCEATERVHAHHRDYSKPLEVVWLCARCHHRLHHAFPETEAHGERA